MLVIGCIEAKFCKKTCVGKLSPRSTRCTPLHFVFRPEIESFSTASAKKFSDGVPFTARRDLSEHAFQIAKFDEIRSLPMKGPTEKNLLGSGVARSTRESPRASRRWRARLQRRRNSRFSARAVSAGSLRSRVARYVSSNSELERIFLTSSNFYFSNFSKIIF